MGAFLFYAIPSSSFDLQIGLKHYNTQKEKRFSGTIKYGSTLELTEGVNICS